MTNNSINTNKRQQKYRFEIFGFQQLRLVEFGLDLADALILRYIVDFENSKSSKVKNYYFDQAYYDTDGQVLTGNGDRHVWIFNRALLEYFPILKFKSTRRLKQKIKALIDKQILNRNVAKNRYTYYHTNAKVIQYLTDKDAPKTKCIKNLIFLATTILEQGNQNKSKVEKNFHHTSERRK